MARRVDQVDPVVLVTVGEVHRAVLRPNGDPAFALQVIGVENQIVLTARKFVQILLAELTGLIEQLVGQGGLAVVNVRDDGDISKEWLRHNGSQDVAGRPWPYGVRTETMGNPAAGCRWVNRPDGLMGARDDSGAGDLPDNPAPDR